MRSRKTLFAPDHQRTLSTCWLTTVRRAVHVGHEGGLGLAHQFAIRLGLVMNMLPLQVVLESISSCWAPASQLGIRRSVVGIIAFVGLMQEGCRSATFFVPCTFAKFGGVFSEAVFELASFPGAAWSTRNSKNALHAPEFIRFSCWEAAHDDAEAALPRKRLEAMFDGFTARYTQPRHPTNKQRRADFFGGSNYNSNKNDRSATAGTTRSGLRVHAKVA